MGDPDEFSGCGVSVSRFLWLGALQYSGSGVGIRDGSGSGDLHGTGAPARGRR